MAKGIKLDNGMTVYHFSQLSEESQDFAIGQYMDTTGLDYNAARKELQDMEEGFNDDDIFSEAGSLIVL